MNFIHTYMYVIIHMSGTRVHDQGIHACICTNGTCIGIYFHKCCQISTVSRYTTTYVLHTNGTCIGIYFHKCCQISTVSRYTTTYVLHTNGTCIGIYFHKCCQISTQLCTYYVSAYNNLCSVSSHNYPTMITLMRMITVGRTASRAAHPTTMPADDMGAGMVNRGIM